MNLKEYIAHVYALEVSCYEQARLIQNLKYDLQKVKNPVLHKLQQEPSTKTIGSKIVSIIGNLIASIFLAILGGIAGIIFWWISGFCLFIVMCLTSIFIKLFGIGSTLNTLFEKIGGFWVEGGGIIISCIGGALIGIITVILSSKDEKSKNKQIIASNKQATKNNEIILSNAQVRAVNLQNQLNQAVTVYNQTCSTKEQFYSIGIIFKKYRNIVPVAMFHEYLMSGRCSQLEGHEGAYNIYEQELRMNLILEKLDDIIYHLDQIERNQYVLANTIREGNRKADHVRSLISNCSDSLNRIVSNPIPNFMLTIAVFLLLIPPIWHGLKKISANLCSYL